MTRLFARCAQTLREQPAEKEWGYDHVLFLIVGLKPRIHMARLRMLTRNGCDWKPSPLAIWGSDKMDHGDHPCRSLTRHPIHPS